MRIFLANQPNIDIHSLNDTEIPSVENLYQTIAINQDNFRERLSHGEKSFEKIGGMFEISNAAEIRQRASCTAESIKVASCGDEVCGMLWYGNEPFLDLPRMTVQEGTESLMKRVSLAQEQGKLAYAKEIISISSMDSGITAVALFYDMMTDLLQKGFTHVYGYLYRVDAYSDGDRIYPTELINGASMKLLKRCGGIFTGIGDAFSPRVTGYSARISPLIFFWEIPHAIDCCKKYICDKNGRVIL